MSRSSSLRLGRARIRSVFVSQLWLRISPLHSDLSLALLCHGRARLHLACSGFPSVRYGRTRSKVSSPLCSCSAPLLPAPTYVPRDTGWSRPSKRMSQLFRRAPGTLELAAAPDKVSAERGARRVVARARELVIPLQHFEASARAEDFGKVKNAPRNPPCSGARQHRPAYGLGCRTVDSRTGAYGLARTGQGQGWRRDSASPTAQSLPRDRPQFGAYRDDGHPGLERTDRRTTWVSHQEASRMNGQDVCM